MNKIGGEWVELKENVLTYELYCLLRESVGWNNFSEAQTRGAIKNSFYSLVAMIGEHPVGMARLVGDGAYFLIVDVIVLPSYQGCGYGKAMIEKLLCYVEEITPVGGRTSVQLIAEKGKENFYEKLGFKLLPHEFCGAGMRKVIRK